MHFHLPICTSAIAANKTRLREPAGKERVEDMQKRAILADPKNCPLKQMSSSSHREKKIYQEAYTQLTNL